jgi:O-acetyl-ADP-ribose deacetylase (regulator of RNase III)
MISYRDDSIFDSHADAIVNAVNCVGVMGAGLAKAFADRYPRMEADYIYYCNEGLLRPGTLHTYYSNLEDEPVIVNFPTKDDWKNPSELLFIDSGMEALTQLVRKFKLKSVAIPALGCGLGGLEWIDVHEIICHWVRIAEAEWSYEDFNSVNWMLYPPQ